MKTLLFLLSLFVVACQKDRPSTSSAPAAEQQKQIWQCPMHPQILRDHQEPCPICGMALVQVKESKAKTDSSDRPILEIEPAVIQKTGVRIIGVSRETLSETLNGFGSTALNENTSQILALRVKAFVTSVSTLNVGNSVRQGQVLAQLYSPEWSQALGEIQLARENTQALSSGHGLLQSAIAKAENLGLEAAIIQSVAKGAAIPPNITLRSPQNGILLDKNIVKGQSIESGAPLFRIADLSQLWLLAEFPQSAAAKVSKGMPSIVRMDANPAKELSAQVEEILPNLNMDSKNVILRMRLSNPGNQIKIGQSAKIALQIRAQSGVFVPEQAVLPSGDKFIVIQSLGAGKFQVRPVQVGLHSQGKIQILNGITDRDSIVESAQFLMDSESNLRAAVQSFAGGDHAAHAH